MSHKNPVKPSQGGHIVIQNQNEDDGQSGVIVVSNTTPMEEIDGINVHKRPPSSKTDLERKRTTSRIATDVEKNVRIRTSRLPSAKSGVSGSGVKAPVSPTSNAASKKGLGISVASPDVMPRVQNEVERFEEREAQWSEEAKFQDYESAFQGRADLYNGEEENFICARFPHLKFCACGVDHYEMRNQPPIEIFSGVFISTMYQSLYSKNLLKLGITHVLNLSAMEFTKRSHYFEYLNLDIFDTHDEDIKKHFRISNRFIAEALQNGGKVLIHSMDSRSRAPAFFLAYLIGRKKKTLKNSLDYLKELWPETEINPYFFKQLEQYDLEKLAIGSTIKV